VSIREVNSRNLNPSQTEQKTSQISSQTDENKLKKSNRTTYNRKMEDKSNMSSMLAQLHIITPNKQINRHKKAYWCKITNEIHITHQMYQLDTKNHQAIKAIPTKLISQIEAVKSSKLEDSPLHRWVGSRYREIYPLSLWKHCEGVHGNWCKFQ